MCNYSTGFGPTLLVIQIPDSLYCLIYTAFVHYGRLRSGSMPTKQENVDGARYRCFMSVLQPNAKFYLMKR